MYNSCCVIVCSPCPFGTYISTACSASSDNVCTQCDVCNNLEYESQTCALGLNTICQSCTKCKITDAITKAACYRGMYYWWYMNNCCVDSNGNAVCLFIQ